MGPDGPAGFGFAAALAVRDACIAAGAAADRLTLKWPNDVLLGGAKLSGLLIELLTGKGQTLAIGIGVNLREAPAVDAYETACLADALFPNAASPRPPFRGPSPVASSGQDGTVMGDDVQRIRTGAVAETVGDEPRDEPRVTSPGVFLALLDEAFSNRIADWRQHGFATLRDAWLSAAHGLGEPATVNLSGETVHGVFADIGPEGAFHLRTPTGLRTVTAGDVFFPSVPG